MRYDIKFPILGKGELLSHWVKGKSGAMSTRHRFLIQLDEIDDLWKTDLLMVWFECDKGLWPELKYMYVSDDDIVKPDHIKVRCYNYYKSDEEPNGLLWEGMQKLHDNYTGPSSHKTDVVLI